MIRILSIFKLVYIDIIYIIPNNINGIIGFNNFIDDYLRY